MPSPKIKTTNGRTQTIKYSPGGAARSNGAIEQQITVTPEGVTVTKDIADVFTQMYEEVVRV
jgi:hypothetical protein|tara:strand:- start:1856 stop:2041 length:186 start_codon:yes stop_codon:yes gene_type:complete